MKHRRRRYAALVAIVVTLTLGCGGRPLPPVALPVTVLVDPGPFASIEAAANGEASVADWGDNDAAARACTESFAAAELRHFLALATGIAEPTIVLARPDRLPPRGDVFVLASRPSTPLLESLLPRPAERRAETRDGYSLRAMRRGERSVFVIAGHSRGGTLYGTYALLEMLGIRFDGLGDTGTVVPRAPAALPRRLQIEEGPRFVTRGFWAFEPRGNRDFFLWMARNRLNLWTAEEHDPALLKKLGMRLTAGGHRVQADYLAPAAPESAGGRTRFAAHPEWYGLLGGTRRGDITGESGVNFCTSNADARRELAAGVVHDLTEGRLRLADVVEVWPLDGGRWCECDRCREQGTPTDRWLDVVAAVCAEIHAARAAGRLGRPIEVVASAYNETLTPPTRPTSPDLDPTMASVAFFPYFRCYAHALADPLCTEINTSRLRAYQGWAIGNDRHYRGPIIIGEYYNVSWVHSLPVLYASVMGQDLPWYAAHGASGLMTMHAPTRLWGAWTLNHVILARLLWNPADRVDSLVAVFCREFFGDASEAMQRCYRQSEPATRNITALVHCAGGFGTSGTIGGRLADPRFPVFPLQHLRPPPPGEPPGNFVEPGVEGMPALMHGARQQIQAARAATHDPIVLARVNEEDRRLAYGEAMVDFWVGLIRVAAADRAQLPDSARAAWPAVESAATRLRAIHEEVQVAGAHANAPDGLAASQVVPTYEFFRKKYGRHSP